MNKFLLLACAVVAVACSNEATTGDNRKDTATGNTSPTVMTSLSTESEMEILEGCVENAKASNLDEAKAYSLCRCVLQKVQQKYPGADSSALVDHMSDTTEVREMVEACR